MSLKRKDFPEIYYELWRNEKLEQTTTVYENLQISVGDVVVEYKLNNVTLCKSIIVETLK